jgi:acyl-coenzyme A thioesterase PaaI-like protein
MASPQFSFSSNTNTNRNMGREERRAAVEVDLRERLSTTNLGMGMFSDSLMRDLRILRYDDGNDNDNGSDRPAPASLILSFGVSKDLCNDFDTLHGGAQATAVDIFTSILLYQVHPVPSVTTDLHVSCVSPAPLGSMVICVCKAEKHGGALQFSSCDLYREVVEGNENNAKNQRRRRVLVAKGLHTKYVVKKRAKGFSGGYTQRSKL